MIPWTLTGTAEQQSVVREAFAAIKFPFERLTLPSSPEIGWRDLNSGMFRVHQTDVGPHLHETGDHHGEGDGPEPLMGRFGTQRNYILGVFYPGTARIYIDNALVNHPELAQSVVSAEIAHAVDEFLPLTDEQRDRIMLLLHGGEHDDHSWWEKVDYGAEYPSLVGETFMILFTNAYSNIPFGNAEDFTHSGAGIAPEAIRDIIGIRRTDEPEIAPAPAPATPEAIPAPFVRYGRSKIYHRPDHYEKKTNGVPVTDPFGLRPCKICKPEA